MQSESLFKKLKENISPVRHLDKEDSDNLHGEKTSFEFTTEMEKMQKELQEYMKKAQRWLDTNKNFLNYIAQDTSLQFKFSDAFYIDLQKGEINMATDWFFERGFTENQILWANMHEIAHFRDLVEDPDRMMENFNYIKERAKLTGQKMLQKWQSVLDFSDSEQKKYFEYLTKTIHQQTYSIHHSFYNCLDDIWVNNFVVRKASRFEKGTAGGDEIEKLYREKLFQGIDYSKLSRHRQFMYALLRQEMIDEKIILSDDVQQIMDTPVVFLGKKYTPREIIEKFIKPKAGRDTLAGERYNLIKKTLEPIFEKLIDMDLADWIPEYQPQQKSDQSEQQKNNNSQKEKNNNQDNSNTENNDNKKPEQNDPFGQDSEDKQESKSEKVDNQENEDDNSSQEGQQEGSFPCAAPFDDEIKEYEKNNIDQFSDQDIENFVKQSKEQKENKAKKETQEKSVQEQREKMTSEQRKAEADKKQAQKWAEQNASSVNMTPEQLLKMKERYNKREAEIAPYLNEMTDLWNNIIYGKAKEIQHAIDGHFKSGSEIDIQEIVNQYPKIQSGKFEETKIFRKITNKEIISEKPELIRVRLVGDMSGSMGDHKRYILQQAFTLIFSSLDRFNLMLESERSTTKSKLRVETEGYVFGDYAKKVKDFSTTDTMTANVTTFSHLHNTIGVTNDASALEKINESITADDYELIQKGKIMDIVLEITDGGSTSEEESTNLVAKLHEKGVITRAFQIGDVNDNDRKIFNRVWNIHDPDKKYGQEVGTEIANLLPAMVQVLKEYFEGVQL